MPSQADRDVLLLRRLLAMQTRTWRGGATPTALPAPIRQFLRRADASTLERLLIETVKRLGDEPATAVPTRAGLHAAIRAELRRLTPGDTPAAAPHLGHDHGRSR